MSSQGEIMFYVYIIESEFTDRYYIGYTSDYRIRWNSHRFFHTRKKSKLYSCMKKHGFDNFELVLIEVFDNKEEALKFEQSLISLDDDNCLNLAPGGEGGFVVRNKNEWRKKLSIARQGRKPALGLKHSEENKEKFRQPRGSSFDITGLTFKEAQEQSGISKTHYYRLLKQIKSNELD